MLFCTKLTWVLVVLFTAHTMYSLTYTWVTWFYMTANPPEAGVGVPDSAFALSGNCWAGSWEVYTDASKTPFSPFVHYVDVGQQKRFNDDNTRIRRGNNFVSFTNAAYKGCSVAFAFIIIGSMVLFVAMNCYTYFLASSAFPSTKTTAYWAMVRNAPGVRMDRREERGSHVCIVSRLVAANTCLTAPGSSWCLLALLPYCWCGLCRQYSHGCRLSDPASRNGTAWCFPLGSGEEGLSDVWSRIFNDDPGHLCRPNSRGHDSVERQAGGVSSLYCVHWGRRCGFSCGALTRGM